MTTFSRRAELQWDGELMTSSGEVTAGTGAFALASHHFWNANDQCFVVRVSQAEMDKAQLPIESDDQQQKTPRQWQTIFQSQPCVPMTGKLRKRGKNPFRGEEIGGRMALLDARTLLLTLGDHGFYGLESSQAFSQDPQGLLRQDDPHRP